MPARIIRTILLLLAAVVVTLPAFFCNSPERNEKATAEGSPWRNVYDTSVQYVGMGECRTCHESIYQTYIQTGMGQSFGHATRQKSAADFDAHALVYDKDLDYYYKPYWQNDSLYIMEFRTEGKDTVHKKTQKIDYIIGSGQHTNSHIFSNNGYFYQAPITFYTQKRKWDLAPGFENGTNTRFSRLIELECMSCHNGYPDFVRNSQNKYLTVKTGIDCERCHGPGGLHVAEKRAGNIVDTSKGPDYSIVNPRRLSTELQNNICQRCHLQGIAVLNDGKSFYDFHPGMKLSEVMNVFMPQYEGARDKMIMASHVERMKKSDCFVTSGKMSCITCHNPHVSVKMTPRAQYINACQGCHGGAQQMHCTEDMKLRTAKGDDCVTCHMPRNGSIDIPHVAVTDHYIRKRPGNDTLEKKITAFLGLKCFNNDNVDGITTARAYMEFFERYNPNKGLIDSALYYLAKQPDVEASQKQNRDYIRAYFLLSDFAKVAQYATQLKPEDMRDAWTAYRIGESCYQLQQATSAVPWYKRAVELLPYALDFQSKYATSLLATGNVPDAQKVLNFVVNERNDYQAANNNLGYIYLQQGNMTMAYDHLLKANNADPDHELTLTNLAVWYHASGQDDMAKKCLQHLLKKHPRNERAKAMLMDIQ
jgi:Tfp pilus assembly protein PilF